MISFSRIKRNYWKSKIFVSWLKLILLNPYITNENCTVLMYLWKLLNHIREQRSSCYLFIMSTWLHRLDHLREKYRPFLPPISSSPNLTLSTSINEVKLEEASSSNLHNTPDSSDSLLYIVCTLFGIVAISAILACLVQCLCGKYSYKCRRL